MNNVSKVSTGETVNLSEMNPDELMRLHYEEECWTAEKLLSLKPFSQERLSLLYKGYEFVVQVMNERNAKLGLKTTSFGASHKNTKSLINIVSEKYKRNNEIFLFEAGVGTGYSIEEVIAHFGKGKDGKTLRIYGCDLFLSPYVQTLAKKYPDVDINIEKEHVYDTICKLPDNSIDVFYADNVVEHFFPDEADIIFSELAKKLKPRASLFMIIPNRHTGPGDVSGNFLPFGAKPKGFHFMEMSFKEVTEMMKKHGIMHSHYMFCIPKVRDFAVKSKLCGEAKRILEPLFALIPHKFIRKATFALGRYTMYMMEAQGAQ